MTKNELVELITETTLPLVKQFVGGDVADVIRAQVEATVKAMKAPSAVQHLFTDGRPVQSEDKSLSLARCARAIAAAKMAGGGAEKALDILRSWGHVELADEWAGARAKALGSGDPTAGGFLIPPQFSTEVIELLRPAAVVRSLNPLVMSMPNGTLKVPKITTGASATYVGENSNITPTQEKFGQITMSWKKLAAIVPISNDLVRYSSPNADAVVRDDIVRAMAQREDQAFIRDDGTASTPRGLKYWINDTNQLTASATVSLAQVTIELGRCMQALMAANIPLIMAQNLPGVTSAVNPTSRAGWILSPRTFRYLSTVQTTTGAYAFRDELMRGSLWGFPYRVTSQVQETLGASGVASELYFGAFAHAIIGEALGLQVDASMDAAYYDGSNVVASFSQDQMVIRVIAEHDFALRHDKSFVLLGGLTWGN